MKWNRRLSMLAGAILALVTFSGCMSDDAYEQEASTKDKSFVKDAAKEGMEEVEMGRVGVSRAQTPEVRQLAQRILTDHTQSNQELMSIAQRKGIETPMEAHEGREVKHMESMGGANFDRMYVMHMLEDHEEDIRKFETAARSANDPEVRSFAARTLPILQQHKRMAEDIAVARGYAHHGIMMSEPAGSKQE